MTIVIITSSRRQSLALCYSGIVEMYMFLLAGLCTLLTDGTLNNPLR